MGGHRRFRRVLVVLGFAVMFASLAATIATVTLNGVVFLIAGTAKSASASFRGDWGRFFLWVIGGLLYIAAGICAYSTRVSPRSC